MSEWLKPADAAHYGFKLTKKYKLNLHRCSYCLLLWLQQDMIQPKQLLVNAVVHPKHDSY